MFNNSSELEAGCHGDLGSRTMMCPYSSVYMNSNAILPINSYLLPVLHRFIITYYMYIYIYILIYIYTVSARIIERSQEDKSTVKYRTFVLLRVPIRSGVGKFNYRTGRRTKVRYFTVLILSSWLRSIISGTDMIFTAYLYIYNL